MGLRSSKETIQDQVIHHFDKSNRKNLSATNPGKLPSLKEQLAQLEKDKLINEKEQQTKDSAKLLETEKPRFGNVMYETYAKNKKIIEEAENKKGKRSHK